MFSELLLAWHDAHARDLPWCGERNPYRIWISEIMLQQTTTKTVQGYYRRFLDAFPTVRDLANAPQERVLKMWEGLGYYSRARNLHEAAKQIVSRHGGALPDTAEALKGLPGVGDYTAGAIASMAFGKCELAMDGNVARVLSRVSAERECVAQAAARRRLKDFGTALMDRARPGDFNQALMGLGNMICVPSGARCGECPVAPLCRAHELGTENELPVLPPKIEKKKENRGVALVMSGGRVLVRRRLDGGLLSGLWEFPGFTDATDAPSLIECLEELGIRARGGKRLSTYAHVFTHLVWKMTLFCFDADRLPEEDDLKAVDAAGLAELPMPTAMRAFREIAASILTEDIK